MLTLIRKAADAIRGPNEDESQECGSGRLEVGPAVGALAMMATAQQTIVYARLLGALAAADRPGGTFRLRARVSHRRRRWSFAYGLAVPQ